MKPTNFSLDYLKPTESSADAGPAGPSDWQNAALRVLQDKGSQDVLTLFEETNKRIETFGSLDVPKYGYDQFAELVENMIAAGSIKVVQQGSVPKEFIVSLPITTPPPPR